MAVPTWKPSFSYALDTVLEPVSKLMTMYKVTTAGLSGTSEPAWPDTIGATVADGTAVWTCLAAQTITWECSPLYETGAVEPVWLTTIGATIVDGNVTWTTRTAAVTDPKCPQSKLAIAISSKIFSPYRDVTRYCVTNNPRDWSKPDDAGFLPSGQHAPTSVEVRAMGEYRGRLALLTASHLQIWTTDPDPAEMGLFDDQSGVGTIYGKAISPVSNDLLFLTRKGVKSLSIAGGATNLATNDVGTPIDSIVQAELAGPIAPLSLYYPGGGQYWLIFGNKVYVLSNSRIGKVGGWSEYVFPWSIEYSTLLDGDLYVRSGRKLYRLEETAVDDAGVGFEGLIHWPYLDMGTPGAMKQMHGFDVVGFGNCEVSFGYDQSNVAAVTPPLPVVADTAPGGMIAMPLCAVSFSVQIRYPPGQAWSLLAAAVYLDDLGF
jgi:hypothetical protein